VTIDIAEYRRLWGRARTSRRSCDQRPTSSWTSNGHRPGPERVDLGEDE
jgi:hypothetical protein